MEISGDDKFFHKLDFEKCQVASLRVKYFKVEVYAYHYITSELKICYLIFLRKIERISLGIVFRMQRFAIVAFKYNKMTVK